MPIFYRVVQRRNPAEPTAPYKWYGVVKSMGRLSLLKFAKRISQESTISAADVYGVLIAFLQLIPVVLDDGHIVDLGEFGSFRTTIRSSGVDTESEFSTGNITHQRVLYVPGKAMKEAIKSFTYKKLSTETAPSE